MYLDRALIDLSDSADGCGAGQWCTRCQSEIRQEALGWIQELNSGPGLVQRSDRAVPVRTWHQDLLLGK